MFTSRLPYATPWRLARTIIESCLRCRPLCAQLCLHLPQADARAGVDRKAGAKDSKSRDGHSESASDGDMAGRADGKRRRSVVSKGGEGTSAGLEANKGNRDVRLHLTPIKS